MLYTHNLTEHYLEIHMYIFNAVELSQLIIFPEIQYPMSICYFILFSDIKYTIYIIQRISSLQTHCKLTHTYIVVGTVDYKIIYYFYLFSCITEFFLVWSPLIEITYLLLFK